MVPDVIMHACARRPAVLVLLVVLGTVLPFRAAAATGPAAFPPDERPAAAPDTSPCVIHVSVDGLRGDVVALIGPRRLPHFYRLRIEGAFTDNARTDYDITVTLPNHTCQLTGRPVLGPDGHGVSFNSDDGRTLEEIHGSYIAGVFDVAHDRGLATGLYASKSKFALFERSWDGSHGAPDTTGVDNGRDKIDAYVNVADTEALLDSFIARMAASPQRYAFIHISDPDAVGHASGWESASYLEAVAKVDGLIGRVLDLIEGDAMFANRTYLIVTADHGGRGTDHSNPADPFDYTIPFYAWGPGVPAGADLYQLNAAAREDPGGGRPPNDSSPGPIRNGETANLSLDLLGLPPVPGSVLDAAQNCETALLGGVEALPAVAVSTPSQGASLAYPSFVVMEATADPRSGAIDRVEFFADGTPLGSDFTAPYEFACGTLSVGGHRLTARAVRDDGIAAAASVEIEIVSDVTSAEPHSLLRALRVHPNPLNGVSTIEFSLPRAGAVAIDLFDVLGRRVDRLFRGSLVVGDHELIFNAAAHAPGVYFLRLRSGGAVRTGKLMIVR
jgi:hypothetical protein